MTTRKRFAAYAWFVLAFAIAAVLWGAGVRATGSGAGCGDQWPLCNGGWLPRAPALHTIIEFTHRITSGPTLGLFVIILVVFAFRLFPRRHIVRRLAVLVAMFTVTEALIGAAPRSARPCRSEFVAESRIHAGNSPAQHDGPARGDGAYGMVCRRLGKTNEGRRHGTASLSISGRLRSPRFSCDQRNGRDRRARGHAVRSSFSLRGTAAGPVAVSPYFCAPACLASDCRRSARMFSGRVGRRNHSSQTACAARAKARPGCRTSDSPADRSGCDQRFSPRPGVDADHASLHRRFAVDRAGPDDCRSDCLRSRVGFCGIINEHHSRCLRRDFRCRSGRNSFRICVPGSGSYAPSVARSTPGALLARAVVRDRLPYFVCSRIGRLTGEPIVYVRQPRSGIHRH